MTCRKMNEEEVFVGAMNAAINGMMASIGHHIYDMAKNDMAFGHLRESTEMVGEVVHLASIAGRYALEEYEQFHIDGQD